jgi:hypothetical protein
VAAESACAKTPINHWFTGREISPAAKLATASGLSAASVATTVGTVVVVEQAMQQAAAATRGASRFDRLTTTGRFDRFATASRFDRLATASRFGACVAAATQPMVTMMEQTMQQTTAASRAASGLAATGGLNRFATASDFRFAAASRFGITTGGAETTAKQMAEGAGIARPGQSQDTRQKGGGNQTNHRSTPETGP